MNKNITLILLLISVIFVSCDERNTMTKSRGDMLNEATKIGHQIEQKFNIKSGSSFLIEGDISRIELNVKESNIDHQALANEIMKMESVQKFKGTLHLLFLQYENDSKIGPPLLWIKYDAKSAKRI